jgi:hypothetical protein
MLIFQYHSATIRHVHPDRFRSPTTPATPVLESEGFYAIRYYAARDPNGNPQADCPINGQDHPDGAAALRDYVLEWPRTGVEFRKQYVILQNDPAPSD